MLLRIMRLTRVSTTISSLQQHYHSPNTLHVILPSHNLSSHVLSSLFENHCTKGTSWLIFIEVPTHELMKDSYIPLNCEVIVVHPDSTLTEVYHLQNSLQESAVGSWTDTGGLQWAAGDFLQRRVDLKGITIKAATVSNPPITVLVKQNEVTSVEGFFGDVWTTLEKNMNFTSVYSVPSDGSFGARRKNGSWSGIISMIHNGEVDIGIGDFTITSIRAQVVDFTLPIIFTRLCVMIRQPDSTVSNWSGFLAPFSTELWITILIAIFLIALHLAACYQHFRFASLSTFLHAVFQVLAMFFLQGQEELPQSLSRKILYMASNLTVMILLAAYSAALISFLTVQIIELPFTTLEGLLEHRSYQFAVIGNSAPLNSFDSSTDPLMKQINQQFIQPYQEKLPKSIHQGLLQVCTHTKYSFMTSLDIAMAVVKDIPCTVIPILGASVPDSLAMPISKSSPYRELINYNLQIMKGTGVMARLRINAWPGKMPQPKPLWTDVGLQTIMPVFSVVAAGIVVALVFLSFESLIHKCSAHFSRKKHRNTVYI